MHKRHLSPPQWLFLLTFSVRLFVIVRLSSMPFFIPNGGDMKFYSDWGLKVAHGVFTDHQSFYGLPGYPFILGLLFKTLSFDKFWVSIVAGLIQALADAFTAVIIWKLAMDAFPDEEENGAGSSRKAIGCIAASGWALYQPSQAFSVVLMPTALAVAAYWYGVWELSRRRSGRPFSVWAPWLPIGVLIGFQAMIVATILFLVPLALVAIWMRSKSEIRCNERSEARPANPKSEIPDSSDEPQPKSFGLRASDFGLSRASRALLAASLLIAGLFIGSSPCWLHNHLIAHEPVMLSAHSGLNFYIGNNPYATGYPKIPPGMSAGQQGMLKDSITLAEKAEGHPLKHYQVSQYWSAKAHDYIATHRADWLRLMAKKFANFWNGFQYDDLSLITLFNNAGLMVPGPRFGWVAALAIPGMVLALFRLRMGNNNPANYSHLSERQAANPGAPISRLAPSPHSAPAESNSLDNSFVSCNSRSIGWIVAAVLLHMAALMPVFVTERYRLAAVPGLLLLAAYGLWEFWSFLNRARWIPAFGYAFAGLAAAFWVATPPADAALWSLDYYNTGIKALDQNDFSDARRDLETAYRYVPDNSEVNFALGLLWQQQGDAGSAKIFYARALAINPRHVGAWNNLGVLASKEKAWSVALRFFDNALRIDPTDAKTHYLEARAYAALGQWDNARTSIDNALRLSPGQKEFQALAARIATRTPLPAE